MLECRPLSDDEIALTLKSFEGRFATRNACLLQVGVVTGFRISELLSIRTPGRHILGLN